MADGKVNITFSTVAQLGGLNALSAGVKTGGREFKDFGEAGAKVVSALEARFRNGLTVAVGESFSLIKDLARGGMWGALAAVAGKAIDFVCDKMKEMDERVERMAKMRSGRARRLAQSIASYAGLAARKEREAYEARAKAMKEYAEAQTKMWREFERNSLRAQSLDAQQRAARRRIDVANGDVSAEAAQDQERIDSARDAVEAAKTSLLAVTRQMEVASASAEDVEAAKKRLAVATDELAAVEAENAKRARDREAEAAKAKVEADVKANEEYARAEREFAEQLRREEKEARDRKIAAMRGSAEKMQEEASALDMAIAAQRKLANEWEANALKARGRDFGDVERERRDDAEGKAAAAFARRNRADERRAQRIAAAGRHARREDRAWLARFREWRDAQDPRNNPAAKAAEALQKRRDALQQAIKKTLDDIKAELKTANTFG